jgi:hypothetical protein
MKKNVIIVFIFMCVLFGLIIIHEKNKMESIQTQPTFLFYDDSMVIDHDSILKMFDEKWEQQQTYKEKSTQDIDSLIKDLEGDKLTIELMLGIKGKLFQVKKECDRKSVIIDSLNNSYNIKIDNLKTDRLNLENDFNKKINNYNDEQDKLKKFHEHKVDSLVNMISMYKEALGPKKTISATTDEIDSKKRKRKKNK